MTTIVSSSYSFTTQIDGRKSVIEIHVDDAGMPHTIVWLADAATDLDAALALHAADLAISLNADEAVDQ